MSLELVRHVLLDEKKKQLQSTAVARSRGLLGLFRAAWSPQNFGAGPPSPTTADERRFLDDNDIAQGRYFDESSIPIQNAFNTQLASAAAPQLPSSPSASSVSNLASLSKATAVPPAPPGQSLDRSIAAEPLKAATDMGTIQQPPSKLSTEPFISAGGETIADAVLRTPTEPSAPPAAVQQPTVDDAVQGEATTHDDATGRAAKTVNLPPSAISTDFAQDEGRRREGRDDESLHPSAADLASSPSSTVGAHSTFTPKAQNHSPDTSPDVESKGHRLGDMQSASSDDGTFRDALEVPLKTQPVGTQPDHAPGAPPADTELQPEQQLRREEEEAARIRDRHAPPKDAELTQGAEQVLEQTEEADREVKQASAEQGRKDTQSTAITPTPTPAPAPKSTPQIDSTGALMPHADGSSHVEPGPSSADVSQAKPMLESMSTRNSTGVVRHKSVSELVGGRPSLNSLGSDGDVGPISSPLKTPATPSRKDSSRPSTALITKRDMAKTVKPLQNVSDDYSALKGASSDGDKDYLTPLFIYQASQPPKTQHALSELVATSHKTLSTAGVQAMSREIQDYRILKRIYQLQFANRWSLRQMEVAEEPALPKMFPDFFCAEMKWMRTDFREERKMKAVVCRNLAYWCAEWVNASVQERKALQVRVEAAPEIADETNATADDMDQPPDLEPSGPNETDSESSLEDLPAAHAAAAPLTPFSFGFDQCQIELGHSSLVETLFQDLPTYKPKVHRPSDSIRHSTNPVAKLSTAKLVYTSQGPPRKRSRYEYEEEDSNPSGDYLVKRHEDEGPYSLTPTRRSPKLEMPPDENGLALFLPENKHVRDRLHASHAFRPPSEFGMPSTSFFEARLSSQWHWDEDQELRKLVKEYSYNWSLIASCLAKISIFASAAERRTPWECFERWVQLEGLPPEMSKTQYFRTYQARLEAAARTVNQAYMAQQQQAQATPNQALLGPHRRRTTQPYRVEKRRSGKHIMMLEAFRKNARKRETALHKQQENAKAAQLRKTQEIPQQKAPIHTPAEFSRIRQDRDQKMAEKLEENRQRYIAAQRNGQMQRQANGQVAQAAAMQANAQQARNGVPNGGQSQGLQVPNMAAAPQNGQGQGNVQMRQNGMPNGMQNNAAAAAAAAAARASGMQATQQMQALMASQQRMSSGSPEQHMNMQYLMQQQQMNRAMMQLSQPGNLANAHLMGAGSVNAMNNPAIVAAMKQMNMSQGNVSNSNGMANSGVASSSPRTTQPSAGGQALSSGHVPAITQLAAQIQRNNPSFSQDQVNQLAASQLLGQAKSNQQFANARQNALNAAAGSQINNMPAMAAGMGMGMNMNVGSMSMNMNMNNMAMNGMQMGYGSNQSVNGSPSMSNVGMNMAMGMGGGQNGRGQGSVSPVQSHPRQMTLQQQQAMARQMAGSPAVGMSMNGAMAGVGSRSATPQQGHRRVGSAGAMDASLSPGARPGSVHGHTGGGGSVPPGSR